MQIGFITTSYPSRQDDVRGVHVHRLAASLAERGLDITVVALSEQVDPYRLNGVQVIPVGQNVAGNGHLAAGISGILPNIRHRPWLIGEIPALMAELARGLECLEGADVIHAHWLYPTSWIVAKSGVPVPIVSTAHGGDVNQLRRVPILRRRMKFAARYSHQIVAVSEGIATTLTDMGVDPSSIVILPVGVPFVDRKQRDWSGPLRVLYVGGLSSRKSVETLLQAFSRLNAGKAASLTVAGDGPRSSALRRQATRLGIRHITFLGAVPPNEVPNLLNWAHVLVLPSVSEGKPTVVMEALGAGVPVLATDIPGTRELVTHGENGFLFPVGDSNRLAAQLARLLHDRTELEQLGERGYASTESFSINYVARRHEELYVRLLTKHRNDT